MSELRKQNGRSTPWKVQYWGVGNENWGCGGNMTADYYADEYRRYATFCKNYPGAPLKKIAGGANSFDYNWTETLMKKVPLNLMWGISLHYYTLMGDWSKKGSATQFDEKGYFTTMQKTLRMDELITRNSTIMDRYDPTKRVALVVDEWGVWTDVEPGTNPGFLYQQNSMRDALIAGVTLNIFNNHADRVRIANLAQCINVLQAVILTDKEKMILTPTYHVMEMYNVHQDATMLPVTVSSNKYILDKDTLNAISVSASKDKNGVTHISLANIDAARSQTVSINISGAAYKTVSGRILTSDKLQNHNSFENPNKIVPAVYNGAQLNGSKLNLNIPPFSVVVLELK
jgi:alpha-N-arabinofuranosidase